MAWRDELADILAEANGDMGLAVALAALRKTENGGPGREMGVLSTPAPTWRDQLRIAARSLRNNEIRFEATGQEPRNRGFFTDECLAFFSAKWAPAKAENDPADLNANHAGNLVRLAADFRGQVLEGWWQLG